MKSWLRHLFFPHETNNFKPRTIHFSALLFYMVFFLLLQFSFRVIKLTRPDVLGFATDINVEKLLELTNLQRTQNGLPPVNLNGELSKAAQDKANDMFAKNYWAHNSPDGTTPWIFINNAGYKYIYAGENLARDFNNSEGVVSAWMASPSHRDNLLRKEYQEVGFAIVNNRLGGEETTLVVQMFGSRTSSTVAQKTVIVESVAARAPIPTPETLPTQNPTPLPVSGQILPSPTIMPTAIPVMAEIKLVPTTLSVLRVAGVTRAPLFNFFNLSKNLASLLTLGLMIILILDGIFIWRKRIIRISGHNLAHVIFLAGLLSALWITGQGVVL